MAPTMERQPGVPINGIPTPTVCGVLARVRVLIRFHFKIRNKWQTTLG